MQGYSRIHDCVQSLHLLRRVAIGDLRIAIGEIGTGTENAIVETGVDRDRERGVVEMIENADRSQTRSPLRREPVKNPLKIPAVLRRTNLESLLR